MYNFSQWIDFAWRPENDGQAYHNEPGDPGGNTNMGVTQKTWDIYSALGVVVGTLKDATIPGLKEVLYRACWESPNCPNLPDGIDIMTADMAMVAGASASAKLLQRCVNVTPDGIIGPITLSAVRQVQPILLIDKLRVADEEFFRNLTTFRLWGNGWIRRIDDCANMALSIITSPSV
jgi:lysozyme family protein